MRSMLEKTLDLAFGAAVVTREKAQEIVDDLIKRGEAAKDESSSMVDDILKRGQKQREEVQTFIKKEVAETLSNMNIATREDLSRMERRIQELETLVEDMRGGPAPVADEPATIVLPPESPAAVAAAAAPQQAPAE